MKELHFEDLDKNHLSGRYFVTLKDQVFTFLVDWDKEYEKGYLSILDENGTDIVNGLALVNGLFIRKREIPYNLFFTNVLRDTYEPTLDTISTDFAMYYEDNQ